MNIHELAELIGPPSCIIALDWPKALGARLDPSERGELDAASREPPCPAGEPRRRPAPEPPGQPQPAGEAPSGAARRPAALLRGSGPGRAGPSG